MQIKKINGNVALVSESNKEMKQLLDVYLGITEVTVGVVSKKSRKSHKRQVFAKSYVCPECSRQCKGNIGLNVHRAVKHGVHKVKIDDGKTYFNHADISMAPTAVNS
jgi:hypothetical protein